VDKEVINDIYMLCRAQLARVVSRIVPPHEVEDVVQETYVRVCQYGLRGEVREPRALMVKTARNLALDHVKRAEVRLADSIVDDEEGGLEASLVDSPLRQAVSDQEFSQFCEAVRQLPLQCRKVFVLKKVYGYSQREIVKEIGLSESTVEKHVARGMRLCAEFLLQKRAPISDASGSGQGGRL